MSLPVPCEVCDRRNPELIVQTFPLHAKCAPGGWVKNDREHAEFMAKVRVLGKTRMPRWERWHS